MTAIDVNTLRSYALAMTRVDQIFNEAMQLDPEERIELMERLRQQAPANEVHDDFSHLDAEERQAMEDSIHEGLADIEAGRTSKTADVIAAIRARA